MTSTLRVRAMGCGIGAMPCEKWVNVSKLAGVGKVNAGCQANVGSSYVL